MVRAVYQIHHSPLCASPCLLACSAVPSLSLGCPWLAIQAVTSYPLPPFSIYTTPALLNPPPSPSPVSYLPLQSALGRRQHAGSHKHALIAAMICYTLH